MRRQNNRAALLKSTLGSDNWTKRPSRTPEWWKAQMLQANRCAGKRHSWAKPSHASIPQHREPVQREDLQHSSFALWNLGFPELADRANQSVRCEDKPGSLLFQICACLSKGQEWKRAFWAY